MRFQLLTSPPSLRLPPSRGLRRTSRRASNFQLPTGGFTLLYAALISSLLMIIGFSVFRLTLKEIQLTSTVKDSQSAFYAADVGIECALYWDFQTVRSAFDPTDTTTHTIGCVGAQKDITGGGGPNQTFLWSIGLPDSSYCIELLVRKRTVPVRDTRVESRGLSSCDAANPRRVERAIEVRYTN